MPSSAKEIAHILADGGHRVGRLWSMTQTDPLYQIASPPEPSARTVKELTALGKKHVLKGCYAEAIPVFHEAMAIADAANLDEDPDDLVEEFALSRDDAQHKYFTWVDACGWLYWFLSFLILHSQSLRRACWAFDLWQSSSFSKSLHKLYVTIEAGTHPWRALYENYDSKEKVFLINALLHLGGDIDLVVTIFRQLQTEEANFPKGSIPATGILSDKHHQTIRDTIRNELHRMRRKPESFIHPTGCFTISYLLQHVNRIKGSVYATAMWVRLQGKPANVSKEFVLTPLSVALSVAHDEGTESAMVEVMTFFEQLDTLGLSPAARKALCTDTVVGEILSKMFVFCRTIPGGVALARIMGAYNVPFVAPVY